MQSGERVMRPEVRAGAGSLAPLGRLGVGEGEEGWGRGGMVTATAGGGGRVGLGIKDVGWCFPALYSAGWGPPSSQLVSLWASSDTDLGTDKQTEDPFDFSFRLGLGGTFEKRPREWPPVGVWWGREPAASLRS